MDDNTQHDKEKVEAVLFTTGRFMDLEEISKICELGSAGYVKDLLIQLQRDYEQRPGALALAEHEGKFKLNIKKQYGLLANKLISTAEFDSPTIKTLAVIAYKNPALQTDIITTRGNKAYDHIRLLKGEGLITSEHQGRTRLLKVTSKFYDYFDTASEEVKRQFQAITEHTKQTMATKAGMTVEEVEQKERMLQELEEQEREKQQHIKQQQEQPQEQQPPEENNEEEAQ